MSQKKIMLLAIVLTVVISISIVYIAYEGNKNEPIESITSIEQTKGSAADELSARTSSPTKGGETAIVSDSNEANVTPIEQVLVAPTIEVGISTYNVCVGKKLDVNDIELSVTSEGDYSVTFVDGSTEKEFTKIGEFAENIVVACTSSNLSTTVPVKVIVADTEKPVISGAVDINATEGSVVDLLDGVSATDNYDGDLTDDITVSKIDFDKLGNQTITYTVQDSSGNTSTTTSTLTVKENIFTAVNKTMYVTSSTLNIRADYNSNTKKLAALSRRDSVKVIATIKGSKWVKVQLSDGTVGYCSSDYLSNTQPAKPTRAPKTTQAPAKPTTKPTTKPTPTPKPSNDKDPTREPEELEKPPVIYDPEIEKDTGNHK